MQTSSGSPVFDFRKTRCRIVSWFGPLVQVRIMHIVAPEYRFVPLYWREREQKHPESGV